MATAAQQGTKQETDILGTLMSLTVAFTLAMAFRGFVLEGFVIPTGSMGPTLMGAHVRIDSPFTGYDYAADCTSLQMPRGREIYPRIDPMLSQVTPTGDLLRNNLGTNMRAGDRVLVLKPLFLVSEPKRWDVVVFKNPTDPFGDTQNFIKRLVGLPNETLLILDGDIFTGPLNSAPDALRIERKPEYVQRAVWQHVYDSDYEPVVTPSVLATNMRTPWPGQPWKPTGTSGVQWKLAPDRAWEFSGTGRTALEWDSKAWPINDWSAYNVLRFAEEMAGLGARTPADEAQLRERLLFSVKDLRVTASVQCADLAHFSTEFELLSGRDRFHFTLSGSGTASVERTSAEDPLTVLASAKYTFTPSSNDVLELEFWHVDQQLWIFANGSVVGQVPYEFAQLQERIAATTKIGRTLESYLQEPTNTTTQGPAPAKLTWTFDTAAPFTLRRVRLDRDLYYRPVSHRDNNQYPSNGKIISGPGFATDWKSPAQLGPDDFLMLGDNSAYSRDGRLWGRAHPLALLTFGDSQPGVVPRAAIIGKAWAVYFPAPLPMSPNGTAFIPDFGRLRFIR